LEAPRTCIASAIALARYLISTIFLITFPDAAQAELAMYCERFTRPSRRSLFIRNHRSRATAGIRVKILGRYRYKIFYRVDDTRVEIVHVRHSAREPRTGGY
jgi:plasmid stabilization system protein ParE